MVGTALQADALAVVGTGALGSSTTFSTWMLEVRRGAEEGAYRVAALIVGASLVVGLGGRELGALL